MELIEIKKIFHDFFVFRDDQTAYANYTRIWEDIVKRIRQDFELVVYRFIDDAEQES
ncbi:hypothetical protein AAEX37_01081 [Oligella sp. MSHR50489EDL]